jgi:septin family protein
MILFDRRADQCHSVLVIGESNSGKTSFIDFLRTSLALPIRKQRPQLRDDIFDDVDRPPTRTFSNFTSHYVETEIEGERIGLTLWDSQGLESNLVDLQLREVASFLESKFEETFSEEMKVVRAPGVRDTHIHCAFLILDPVRLDSNIATTKKHGPGNGGAANGNSLVGPRSMPLSGGLDESFELQVLRTLQGKTTVVPIIAKADTITSAHMAHLKHAVWKALKSSNLNHLEAIGLEEGGDPERSFDKFGLQERDENQSNAGQAGPDPESSHLESPTDSSSSHSASEYGLAKPSRPTATASSPALSGMVALPVETPSLPFSIISPDIYEPEIAGRKFPWGFADPYNPDHCDFLRLKETVFTDWRGELKDASRELWYERWRTSRLNGAIRGDGQVGWAR